MPLPTPKQRTAYGTYLYFAESGTLETFLPEYLRIPTINFQKIRIEAAGNIGAAVRNTIPGIGTGNHDIISSGCVERGDLMVLPQGTSFLSTWDGIYNASARFYMMRGNCGKRTAVRFFSGFNDIVLIHLIHRFSVPKVTI